VFSWSHAAGLVTRPATHFLRRFSRNLMFFIPGCRLRAPLLFFRASRRCPQQSVRGQLSPRHTFQRRRVGEPELGPAPLFHPLLLNSRVMSTLKSSRRATEAARSFSPCLFPATHTYPSRLAIH
jgi:hypothetical protein